MKKSFKELEMKGKGYKKRLDELQVALTKHMEQYVLAWKTEYQNLMKYDFNWNGNFCQCRIHKDEVDPEKLQATLMDQTLSDACDLRKALEMVALLDAQLKEMSPNLDSITEYRSLFPWIYWSIHIVSVLWCCSYSICYRYRKKVELYNERVEDLNMVTQQRDDIKKQYDDWRKRRHAYLSLRILQNWTPSATAGSNFLTLMFHW